MLVLHTRTVTHVNSPVYMIMDDFPCEGEGDGIIDGSDPSGTKRKRTEPVTERNPKNRKTVVGKNAQVIGKSKN